MSRNKTTKIKTKTSAASEKRFNATVSLITVFSFFGLVIGLGCATAFSEKKEISENLNRKLATFPELTVKKYYNGSFTEGIEKYVSDHFIGHDGWIAAKTRLELLMGKRERGDTYILKDRLVEKIAEPDPEVIQKTIDGIRKYAEDNGVNPYLMLVPTQAEIYKDMLPANAPNPDQQAFIKDVYSQLDGTAVCIDVYSAMAANRSDYIYYRTDHHWTTKGAFIAYNAAGEKMGYEPLGADSYDIDHAGEDFKGTFYSRTLYDGIEYDTLDIWLPTERGAEVSVEVYETFGAAPAVYDSMYFREYLDVKDKYSAFLGTNKPMITVKTGNKGEKLLIFKDSYAHCYVPFLTEHYSEITMIDMRYISLSYKDLIDVSQYDKTMFLYNVSTFMSDENLKKLMF